MDLKLVEYSMKSKKEIMILTSYYVIGISGDSNSNHDIGVGFCYFKLYTQRKKLKLNFYF